MSYTDSISATLNFANFFFVGGGIFYKQDALRFPRQAMPPFQTLDEYRSSAILSNFPALRLYSSGTWSIIRPMLKGQFPIQEKKRRKRIDVGDVPRRRGRQGWWELLLSVFAFPSSFHLPLFLSYTSPTGSFFRKLDKTAYAQYHTKQNKIKKKRR